MKFHVRLLAVIAGLGLVAAACGGSNSSSSGGSQTGGSVVNQGCDVPPRHGGTLDVLFSAEFKGFDPMLAWSNPSSGDGQRMAAIYDKLVYVDPDTVEVVPRTAESLSTTDGKVWVLKIRPGITFTDGTSYDAGAVKFNWDRLGGEGSKSPFVATLRNMTTRVVDPLTVEITLKEPNNQFGALMADQLSYIASPAALTAAGSPDAYNTAPNPVGAGPFKVRDWVKDSQLVLDRNPTYWNQPEPFLDTIVMKPVADEQQRINAFRAGQADVIWTTDPLTVDELKGISEVVSATTISTFAFRMNMAREPFNDLRVRRAMQLVVDVEQANQVLSAGAAQVPRTYLPEATGFADGSVHLPGPDLAQAQRLIDEYLADTGKTGIEFQLMTGNTPQNQRRLQLLQQQIQRLNGVTVVLNPLPTAEITPKLQGKDFDVALNSYQGVEPEPNFSESLLTGAAKNYGSYTSSAFDDLIAKARTTADPNERKKILKEAQRVLITDLPLFPFVPLPSFFVISEDVCDLNLFDDNGLLAAQVWLKG